MDTMTVITLVGTITSIGASLLSFWQASQSKDAANTAKQIRSQLVGHREASELAQLQAVCKKAQKSMEKYGPASQAANLAGISTKDDAANVQEFILLFKEQRAHFGESQSNEADQFCEVLTPLLDQFAEANSSELFRQHGKLIVIHLSTIAASIKAQLDGKRETVR
jgi:hypothetical protein